MAFARNLPRIVTREHAARYCGHTSLVEFDKWARRVGCLPVPGRRSPHYCLRQIDAVLDVQMGLSPALAPASSVADEYFAADAHSNPEHQEGPKAPGRRNG